MIKKLVQIVFLLLCVFFVAACGQPAENTTEGNISEEQKIIKIGYTLGTMDNPYLQEFSTFLQKLCDEKGISLEIADGDNDVAKQILYIQEWMDREFDAVICSPIEPTTLQTVIDDCMEKGIPFINVDSMCERYTTYLGIDQEEYGYLAGKITADWLNENYQGYGMVDCAVLTKPQSLAVIERANGIVQGIEENCAFANIVVTRAYSDVETAKEAVLEILEEYPQIKSITGVSDMSILGAYQAYEEKGLLEEEVCLVGIDATKPVLELIREETIVKGTVSQSSKVFADKTIEAVEKAIAGEMLDKVFLDIEAVTLENVNDFLDD